MKTTIVPAQVTTVEDKIAGNLGFTQLMLLVTPIFLGAAVFTFFPPFLKVTIIKTVLVALLAISCIFLAVRIKGVILLHWLQIIGQYNLRPKHYVHDKNSVYLRETKEPKVTKYEQPSSKATKRQTVFTQLSSETAEAAMLLDDPSVAFHLAVDKKGVLRAYIQEVKSEAV